MSESVPTGAAPAAAPPSVRLPAVLFPLAGSAFAWAALCAALPPAHQDFPLNDDWAFGRGAFRFARGEGIHYGGWASMPQLGQWLWAAPFLWVLGPSFFSLRAATVVLSWLGLWAFYDLLRQQGYSPGRAAFTTAALAANPLFVLLQGTFMTDVPALSLSLGALALYGRALSARRPGWLAAACVVATLAAITRQNTAVVAVVAAVGLWREPDLRRRAGWWLGVLLPATTAVATHLWFQGRSDVRALQPGLPDTATLLSLPFVTLHLAGLSALPVLLAVPRVYSWRVAGLVAVFLAACAWVCWGYPKAFPYGGLFPYTENMISPWGAFAGSHFTGLLVPGIRPPLLASFGRACLTVAGCLAGAALVDRLAASGRPALTWFLGLFTVLQVPFLLIAPDLYDRYFLFLLPGALAPAWGATPGERDTRALAGRWLGFAALATLALVSLGLMHDWLAWNDARWTLGRRALADGVPPLDIEGGVEWDGWYAPDSAPNKVAPRPYPVLPFTEEWFPAVRGRYALSFSELSGTRRVDAEPYDVWLPPARREFFRLELPPARRVRGPGR